MWNLGRLKQQKGCEKLNIAQVSSHILDQARQWVDKFWGKGREREKDIGWRLIKSKSLDITGSPNTIPTTDNIEIQLTIKSHSVTQPSSVEYFLCADPWAFYKL